ncbi:hypothetical protein D3C80_1423790 [compost metagenome]
MGSNRKTKACISLFRPRIRSTCITERIPAGIFARKFCSGTIVGGSFIGSLYSIAIVCGSIRRIVYRFDTSYFSLVQNHFIFQLINAGYVCGIFIPVKLGSSSNFFLRKSTRKFKNDIYTIGFFFEMIQVQNFRIVKVKMTFCVAV